VPHLSRSRISRHPLHFNDADEVSCRAGAIKCSRCRASFAPIRTAFAERNLVPPLDRPLADPLSETKNWRNLPTGKCGSQVSHSLPAHLERFIGDEAIPDSRLGLDETWTCRITFNLLAKVGDINGSSDFRAPDFAKDVAVCENSYDFCFAKRLLIRKSFS
jgi:hypothetical protein